MIVDILAIGVHPDDIELCASGTIFRHLDKGYKVALCDLTQGELGSRGDKYTRRAEAETAKNIFGIEHRLNLEMADGFFEHNNQNILKIITVIRRFRPKIILCNAPHDRHPDHGRASKLVSDACFYSGLSKIETSHNSQPQEPWRPQAVYHYIQDRNLKPDFVVDISPYFDKKIEVILAYKTQFNISNEYTGIRTPISNPSFLEFIKSKNKTYARDIDVEFAEGFIVERCPGVNDLFDLR